MALAYSKDGDFFEIMKEPSTGHRYFDGILSNPLL